MDEASERKQLKTISRKIQIGGGNFEVWAMYSWYSLDALIIVKYTMDQHKYVFALVDQFHYAICELFFHRTTESTSRAMLHCIQLKVYMCGSKSTRILPYSSGRQTLLS